MKMMVCNAGSTSLKFKVYEMPEEKVLATGGVERVGALDDAIFKYSNTIEGKIVNLSGVSIPSYQSGIEMFLSYLTSGEYKVLDSVSEIKAVGFKTVLAKGFYGVHELREDVLDAMRAWLPLAPVHNTAYLESIAAMKKVLPEVRMIGAFETAFHTTIPMDRKMYGIPYEWYEKYGIQRLGFHGASHSYIASVLDKEFGEYKAVSCHLGGSGSICAIENGRSVDTSFGLSLETGLIHANRVGDMDPTIVFFLEEQGLSKKEIKEALTKNGGLKGISGVSGDLRYVEKAAEEGNERAQLALDVYIRGIIHYAASFASDMGGLDALVFTAGIGEHSSYVRGKVVEGLSILGLEIDEKANEEGREVISKPSSPVRIMVIPTDEEIVVARKSVEYIINHQ